MAQRGRERSWTLLTSHCHVLVEIARNPEALVKELSAAAGLTERATTWILADLVDAGYVTRERFGRRNRYRLHLDRGFRHASQRDLRVGPFLDLLTEGELSRSGALHLPPPALGLPQAEDLSGPQAPGAGEPRFSPQSDADSVGRLADVESGS